MFKHMNKIIVITLVILNQSVFAKTGKLFNVVESGLETELQFIACLTVAGNKPISCQQYTSGHSTVQIYTTPANHYYKNAGIKILTSGFTLDNLGLSTPTQNNGYGVFEVSQTVSKTTDVPTQLSFQSVGDPNLSMQIDPVNILDPNYSTTISDTTTTLSLADLEKIYESNFCQLSTTHNVTWDSTECQALVTYIKNATGFNFDDKPILINNQNVTDVTFQKINYDTTVDLPAGSQTFPVSGGLLMPTFTAGHLPKGVIVYFQGTQFDKSGVGSNVTFPGTQLVAGIFASQGYVVVIPDYIGMGDDYADVHPYVLYPTVSAKTAVDMLRSTGVTTALAGKYGSLLMRLFSVGYSEGGAYSLWFNTYVRAHFAGGVIDGNFTLVHSVGLEGAFNTSSVTYGYLFSDVVTSGSNTYNIQNQSLTNLSKPTLAADCFLSYATYSPTPYDQVFNKKFYDMECTGRIGVVPISQSNCDFNGQNLNMLQAFTQANVSPAEQSLYSALNKTTAGVTSPDNLGNLATATLNNAESFIVNAAFLTNQTLLNTLSAADVNLSSLANGAVSIISLTHDSIVTPNNSTYLFNTYPTKLGSKSQFLDETQFQVVSPFAYERTECKNNPNCAAVYTSVDHEQAQIYEFIYALNIFNSL